MFGEGRYASIWATEDKGKYTNVELSTSVKSKETGEYETDFSSKYVTFLSEAHKKAAKLQRKDRIKIGPCGVTTRKGKDDKYYTNFLVFDFEMADAPAPKTADYNDYDGGEDPV